MKPDQPYPWRRPVLIINSISDKLLLGFLDKFDDVIPVSPTSLKLASSQNTHLDRLVLYTKAEFVEISEDHDRDRLIV